MTAESLLQVVELLPGPALVVGPGGEILGANDRAERWIGTGCGPLTGQPLARLVSDAPARVDGFLEECARTGRKVAGTLTPARGEEAGEACRVEGIAVQDRSGGDGPGLVLVHVVSGGAGDEPVVNGREDALEALRG